MKVDRKSPWLVAFGGSTSATKRLFCFPYAGGGASFYRRLAQHAPPGTEICSVQLPGREDRYSEPAFTSLHALVLALVPALRPHLDRPFAFFGHSMGALIAFELARELRRHAGAPAPEHLFVSGRRAPHLPGRRRALHALPGPEFWREVTSLQGTPAEVLAEPELMDLVEPILRADFAVCETYACSDESPLVTPVTALGGSEDPETTREELEAWREHTTHFGGVRLFAGHHFYLQSQWVTVADVVAFAGADD